MRRLLLALAACGILGLAAAVGAVQWFDHAWTAPGPVSGERVVVVERGEGLEQIAARLIAAGALHPEPLRGRWPFLLGARLT
ncbi:MAG: hypothetical protein LDL22_01460, partial [Hyphomicrobiales bacterium]|nr:hypothetical protein [Hyphomicrobiales bacterium]